MKVLINSTVLSNFAAVDRLPLLHALYGTVYIAEAVYEEAQDGLEEGYTFLAVLDEFIVPFHPKGWLHLVNMEGEKEFLFYQKVPSKLHRGEAVSLAIAAHRQWGFLTDDQAARRYAKMRGKP
jgi:predicted nucleic acid-binding protein